MELSQAPTLIMFVRHGEKPNDHGAPHGVNHQGEADEHSLSVRGWMRAGGLAGLLSNTPIPSHPNVQPPQRIVATGPSPDAKSHREINTANPIAQRLGLHVESDLGRGSELQVRDNLLRDPRVTLVVWHHGELARLVHAFPISNAEDVPERWPEERFDLFWILRRNPTDTTFSFTVTNQALLEGDVTSPS
ncbi:MAG: hypothetical protein KGR25_08775 [Chloroflexi bacterium]|nr:hypothetical protein [Chloroflexota bacterium]